MSWETLSDSIFGGVDGWLAMGISPKMGKLEKEKLSSDQQMLSRWKEAPERELENEPNFNAGRGSILTRKALLKWRLTSWMVIQRDVGCSMSITKICTYIIRTRP
ncbi:hypothetical protein F0562_023749 [Nyssa sinensis]|uniref:Uncharacterized protein n=1 Tax=Nyssa sinensis TaxID=561372 RepID=A0A5J5BLB1_9ASTE|nr:hypothetical protein F0562_023749 [Nyssa sinensis]